MTFQQLVPFGITGLAMYFVYRLAQDKQRMPALLVAVAAILALVMIEKLLPTPKLVDLEATAANGAKPAAGNASTISTIAPAPPNPLVAWVDIGAASSDWTGNDRASTMGAYPKRSYKPNGSDKTSTLCDKEYVGHVAICWDNRTSSSTVNVPTDIVGTVHTWCVYKLKDIKVSTPLNGTAPNGRVYVCGRTVEGN